MWSFAGIKDFRQVINVIRETLLCCSSSARYWLPAVRGLLTECIVCVCVVSKDTSHICKQRQN